MPRTRSTPGMFGSRRSRTMRSICFRSARTRASSSAALLTAIALWPAPSTAARKRSRTKAVSSAITTVLVETEVVDIREIADPRGLSLYSRKSRGGARAVGFYVNGDRMATCPECDAEIEVDEFDVDKGDQLSCPECGSNLEVVALSPLELDIAAEDDEDEDEDDLETEEELGAEADDDDDDEDEDADEEDEGWDE